MKQIRNFDFLVFKVWYLGTGIKNHQSFPQQEKKQHKKRSPSRRLDVTFNYTLCNSIVCNTWPQSFSVWWDPLTSQNHRQSSKAPFLMIQHLHQVISCNNISAWLKLNWHLGYNYFPSLVQGKMQNSDLHFCRPVVSPAMPGTDEFLYFSRKINSHRSWGCGQDCGRQPMSKLPNSCRVVFWKYQNHRFLAVC